jgi:uncharacterized protein
VTLRSALYFGTVVHRRLKPKSHHLSYGVYYLLVDLDELSELHDRSFLFSHNRFNLISFHDRDHGAGDGSALRGYVLAQLATAGIDLEGGTIRLLAMPRVLGYVFNPLSIYFCHRAGGELAAILYEVTNTFGQRHSYLAPARHGTAAPLHHACDKHFYVSPFIHMATRYHFRVRPPADDVAVTIEQTDSEGAVLYAALTARRTAFTDAALLRAFITHPLLTLKVIGGIHWEAVRLWLKGLRPLERPQPPERPITIIPVSSE